MHPCLLVLFISVSFTVVTFSIKSNVSAMPARGNKYKNTSTLESVKEAQSLIEDASQNRQEISLTLSDVVALGLENNRNIKNAYLDRIAQRYDLKVEEDKFKPDVTPSLSVEISENNQKLDSIGETNNSLGEYRVSTRASLIVPTGGEFRVSWIGSNKLENTRTFDGSEIDGDRFTNALEVSFKQPFLRGAGISVNRASVEIARSIEEFNILSLKTTLIDTITTIILAYRNLLQAKEQVAIERISLQKAKELLKINKVLIDAGRLAPLEIVQSETEVANREVRLIGAQNNFESAMLALIEVLDIDQNHRITATESLTVKPKNLESEKLTQLAINNRPDYLQAKLNLVIAKLRQKEAKNGRLWDFSLNANYRQLLNQQEEDEEQDEWIVGLSLSKTFGDLTLEQRVRQSKVDQLKAENTLDDIRERIKIEVTDQIRNVELSFRQVELARQARELSENQLEIERKKLQLGRSSTFQIVNFQNDLVQAKNNELEATINYLNAITRLEQVVGITLDTWNVTVENDE